MSTNKKITHTIGEFVSLIGMLMFFYTLYLIVNDYMNVHDVFSNIYVARPTTAIQDVFENFEKVVIYTVTKLLPISLVLISAGALTAPNLLSPASRVLIVSLSAFTIVMAAYFVGGEFELVCAADQNKWFAWNDCMATVFPVGILSFTSILILTKKDTTASS